MTILLYDYSVVIYIINYSILDSFINNYINYSIIDYSINYFMNILLYNYNLVQ